jgi:methylthioribulose-1-phosphate dehydratase
MAEPAPAWAIDAIVRAGERMDSRGWVPATAGNISVRLPDGRIAITRSGPHKGFLQPGDVMLVDRDGGPLSPDARPSAETGLHCQIYRLRPEAGAVLHGHSVAATALSMADPGADRLTLAGYEVLKALGCATHDLALDVPVVDNDQDIPRLAAALERSVGDAPAYVIRGHGVYVWGADMPAALNRLEALEFLLACEVERRRMGGCT